MQPATDLGQSSKMDVGLAVSLSSNDLDAVPAAKWAHEAAAAGFSSVWSLDNPLSDQAEPLILLTAVACTQPTLGIGTGALVAPIRDPILLAKQAATLDWITSGRFVLGLTIGRRPADYELIGADFHVRGRVLEDTVKVIRSVWAGDEISVHGRSRDWISKSPVGIPPRHRGSPKLILGGQSPRALERAVRLGDGYLASATGGPAKAELAYQEVVKLLEGAHVCRSKFVMTTNVFVVIDKSAEAALNMATETFTRRHGGPPPYDPAEVVVYGDDDDVALALSDFARTGWDGINLVPVVCTQDQIRRLGSVVSVLNRLGGSRGRS